MSNHPRPASLARRAFPALAVLGASGALLTQLGGSGDAGAQSLVTAGATASPPTGGLGTTAPPITTTTNVPSATTGRAPTTGGTGSTATTTTLPRTTTTSGATAGSTSSPTCTGTTFTGGAYANKYGIVQIAAVISADKRLCDVQVVSYPDGDRKSVAINQRALPTLRTQAIAANNARIAGVSGATYTTQGYQASLQSALDAAK